VAPGTFFYAFGLFHFLRSLSSFPLARKLRQQRWFHLVPCGLFVLGGVVEIAGELFSANKVHMSTTMHIMMDLLTIMAGVSQAVYVLRLSSEHAGPCFYALFWIANGFLFNIHRQKMPFTIFAHAAIGQFFYMVGAMGLLEYMYSCATLNPKQYSSAEASLGADEDPKNNSEGLDAVQRRGWFSNVLPATLKNERVYELPFAFLMGYFLMMAGWLAISMAPIFEELDPMDQAGMLPTDMDSSFWMEHGVTHFDAFTNLVKGFIFNLVIVLSLSAALPDIHKYLPILAV